MLRATTGLMLPVLLTLVPACALDSEDAGLDDGLSAERTGEAAENFSLSASTWPLPYRGGSGGSPYSLSCGANQVGIGLYGRSGAYVDQLGLVCADLRSSGALGQADFRGHAGGIGGSPFYALCPVGQALVGMSGRSGGYIDQIGIQCARVTGWHSGTGVVNRYAGGGEGGSPFSDTCPAGYVITSITGRSGSYADAAQGFCTYLNP